MYHILQRSTVLVRSEVFDTAQVFFFVANLTVSALPTNKHAIMDHLRQAAEGWMRSGSGQQ